MKGRASIIIDRCKSFRDKDLGWEDAFVDLVKSGLAHKSGKSFIRRFYLSLSEYTRRYGS